MGVGLGILMLVIGAIVSELGHQGIGMVLFVGGLVTLWWQSRD